MTADKKDRAIKIRETCAHRYVVTGWSTKGGHQNATHMRCTKCLEHLSLEELESKEWREAQGF
jgi:hypothetical protein